MAKLSKFVLTCFFGTLLRFGTLPILNGLIYPTLHSYLHCVHYYIYAYYICYIFLNKKLCDG